jgi:transcription initiation factor TFIID subunit TAF12
VPVNIAVHVIQCSHVLYIYSHMYSGDCFDLTMQTGRNKPNSFNSSSPLNSNKFQQQYDKQQQGDYSPQKRQQQQQQQQQKSRFYQDDDDCNDSNRDNNDDYCSATSAASGASGGMMHATNTMVS